MQIVQGIDSNNSYPGFFAVRESLRALTLILGTVFCIYPQLSRAESPSDKPAKRPNFVFILIDDMRWDVMSCAGHPFVRTPHIDRIAKAGARFTNAFVTTSLCSPARASFLTGCYAHRHGVRFNSDMDLAPEMPTFPKVLKAAGYHTAYVGKWHMSGDPNPRPGFNYWLSFFNQGEYVDPELNENGRNFKVKGYMTDLLTQYAADYLNRTRTKPFCLYLSHKAMHAEFIPAERHKNLYKPSDLLKPISWRDTLEDKPRWLREVTLRGGRLKNPIPEGGIPAALEPSSWDPTDEMNQRRLNWHRTLAAVDESVGQVLDTLKTTGAADNTYVIFAGDNGFFLGEHRRMDKRLAYEESIRIPLLISGPKVVNRGSVLKQMVLNIDLAPTILDLAGIKIPAAMQGCSIVPLLAGKKTKWRKSFLYEYFMEDWLPGIPTMAAVRTEQWKYIRYPEIEDTDELYDLTHDPHEMQNLVKDLKFRDQLAKMRAEMDRLLKETR
ncbi:MAG: sulfatase [Planctomycetota bacterium]|nr:MAG: sulfatase [Planctomycetota bacterium]